MIYINDKLIQNILNFTKVLLKNKAENLKNIETYQM